MKRTFFALVGVLLLAAVCFAQVRPAVVRASGEATVSANPDQVKISVGVVTQAQTAQEAASQNANQVSGVITQVKQVVGSGAEIKTVTYTLSPNYTYPPNAQPILNGYIATNIIEVTTGDLSVIGKVIDTGIQAGANRVQSLVFGLKDPQPAKAQALRTAAQKAKASADAIASGLGARTGAVLIAQEGSSISVLATASLGAAAGATTPVEPGLVTVHAMVTVEVEMLP